MNEINQNPIDPETTEKNEGQYIPPVEKFAFLPYENDHQSLQIGELTFENQTDKVIVYGDIEINKDRQGLNQAIKLQRLFNLIVSELEAAEQAGQLTEPSHKQGSADRQSQSSKEVDNPFS